MACLARIGLVACDVAGMLERLAPEGWRWARAVETPTGTVDTVVAGPGGLFALHVDARAGRLHVDAIEALALKQAYTQATWVRDATGRPATPLLVFSRAHVLGRSPIHRVGVAILPARALVEHLRRYQRTLDPATARSLLDRIAPQPEVAPVSHAA